METLLLLPLIAGVCVGPMFSNFVMMPFIVESSSCRERAPIAGCFALMWCGYPCSVSLPREAVGQSAVCDCEIPSWSYSFVKKKMFAAIPVVSSLYKYMK